MRIEELEVVAKQAAIDLLAREGRPLPAAVVVPLPEATRVTTLPDFPDDDGERFDLLSRYATDVLLPANAPAFAFLGEAVLAVDGGPADVVVVVYAARGHAARITAAPFEAAELGEFAPAEDLDPSALPFLAPLQHAVEAARPPDAIPADVSVLPLLP